MTAPHFFADDVGGDTVTLTGEDAEHAVRALRIREGETITVSDGAGAVVEAKVVRADARTLTADVLSRHTVREQPPRLIVFPALPKAGKLDMVVQKLTEIGVDEIHPWPASRSVVRWDARKARAQHERLSAIAREAAKQSRRARLPIVTEAKPIENIPVTTIILHEQGTDRLLGVLPRLTPREIGIIVGPEGGLAETDLARLRAMGARCATLGQQILRTETAPIVAATIVFSLYGRIG